MPNHHTSGCHSTSQCGCCGHHSCSGVSWGDVNRRTFLASASALTLGSAVFATEARSEDYDYSPPGTKPLRVLPVLTYDTPQPRPQSSWRNWGGIQTEQDAAEEIERISNELDQMKQLAEYSVEFLPVVALKTQEEAENLIAETEYDVMLMYAAGAWLGVLETLTRPDRWNMIFVRRSSGPVYLWYEIVHNRFLRKTVDEPTQPGIDFHDVVVDDLEELVWRLRALHGLKNTLNKRIVTLGGPGGWGVGGQRAPELATDRFGLEYWDENYDAFAQRVQRAMADRSLMRRCREEAEAYLKRDGVDLQCDFSFVENGFMLYRVFKAMMAEAETDAFTVHHCMGTIMPIAETTACLTLTLLNDEGFNVYCESDFVAIPAGMLLHYVCGKPVFFCNPNYPHNHQKTVAHCTAPSKMDGETYEPLEVMTHFESDYGSAPKVEMRLGQKITVVNSDFNFERWIGLEAEIVDNPYMDVCRTQSTIQYGCEDRDLYENMRGFHWNLCYGDYLKEMEYALGKTPINWLRLT